MIVYRGSSIVVDKPRILQSERFLDFGTGFYTSTNKEQASHWALRVAVRRKAEMQYISVYEFDYERAEKELKVIRFERANEEWLNFICACRSGKSITEEYDLVFGPVADDNVYATVQLYELGVLDKDETIKRLKVKNSMIRCCFILKKHLAYAVIKSSSYWKVKSNGYWKILCYTPINCGGCDRQDCYRISSG